ncbi:hypothetical protein QJS04_geneDACA024560 [Acorus gramineus]|uniref:Uncharacterized protein n=1 Tax=Acorus gramineus TaxID=55184 RepID=A0AAV8ZWG4_ACOGR|nr:hypothetical protein QJS04_geneDACA024560 [Acorus gramineus]
MSFMCVFFFSFSYCFYVVFSAMARRKRPATLEKEKQMQPLKKARQSTKPSSTKLSEKRIPKNLRSNTNKKTIQKVIERLVPRDVENTFLSKKVTQGTKNECKQDGLESIIAERDRLFEENVRLMKENDRLTYENSRLTAEIHMWMKSFHNAQSGVKRDEDEILSTRYSMSSSTNEDVNKDEYVENDQDVCQVDKDEQKDTEQETHTTKDESKEKGKGKRDKKKGSKISSPYLLLPSSTKRRHKTVPMDDLDELDKKLIGNFLSLEMNG